MGRILAIDYGAKRCGIAVTDPMQIIASGLTAVPTKKLFKFLTDYFREEEVHEIVLGDPRHLSNDEMEIKQAIRAFADKFSERFPNKGVHWVDERFTSKIAQQSLVMSGVKKKQRQKKELVDEVSATLILQSFMESKGM